MRQIKFRVWDTILEKMLDMREIEASGMNLFTLCDGVDIMKLMEWTGLVDKTGAEIYEGDIVRLRNSNGFHCLALVEFNDGCFELKYQWPLWEDGMNKPRGYVKQFVANHAIEIIGNVHTTPHLWDSE